MMETYRFHCTDGCDLVLDGAGRQVDPERLEGAAQDVAKRLVSGLPGWAHWSDWSVSVHDAAGRQICTVPFSDVLEGAGADA